MTAAVSKSLIATTVSLLLAVSNFAQGENPGNPQYSIFNLTGKGQPIVFAKETDGLPNSLLAKGKIVQASVSGTYCGTMATGGTLKIKLSEKIESYNGEYLYVVVLCLAGEENENIVDKNIEIEVIKMSAFPYRFSVLLSNSIDSKGIPFYLSKVDGVGGLLKKLANKPSNTSNE